jgi:hypothetical protein
LAFDRLRGLALIESRYCLCRIDELWKLGWFGEDRGLGRLGRLGNYRPPL